MKNKAVQDAKRQRCHAQVAPGLSHRVGRRPLRNPARDGEISHLRVTVAGVGQLGHGRGQQVVAPRITRRTHISAQPLRWSRQVPCCFVTPRMRIRVSPSARRKENWSRTRRCAPICRAPWCMTRRRMVFSARATMACSILPASRSPVRLRGLCRGCNWSSAATSYLP